jgi:putative transposase
VTRGGYYAWKKRQPSQRAQDNQGLLKKIVDIHKQSRETYGYPRVHAALKRQGETCGRHRVARIMQDYGIQAKMSRRFKKHSHRHHLIRTPRNLLLDRAPVTQSNEVWVCDVTYVRVGKDWNYLCTVMDLYTRKIIGWHFARSLDATVAREALLMALEEYRPGPGTIFHTDQGPEFGNKELKAVLDEHNLLVSKSRKGCCWDNANMESFYHTLKTEMVYFHEFDTLVEALAHIMDYIRFYNQERLHSSLDYQSPNEYELKAA